jgi:hypothetical protein
MDGFCTCAHFFILISYIFKFNVLTIACWDIFMQCAACLYIPQCLCVRITKKLERLCWQHWGQGGARFYSTNVQFICVIVKLVQAKCVCCTCVRSAFYRVAVIFLSYLEFFSRNLPLYVIFVGAFCRTWSGPISITLWSDLKIGC